MAYIAFSHILLLFPFHSFMTCAHLSTSYNHSKRLNDMKKCILHPDYLKCNHNFNNRTNVNINISNDPLKAAIKRFARVLDPDNIEKMHKSNRGKDSIHEVSCYTFFPGSSRWPSRNITYAFRKNVKVKQQLEHALQQWASVSSLRFYRVKKFSQADIWISFLRGDHGDQFPFDGAHGHVAHAFEPPNGRVHFDAAQNWSINGRDKDGLDMETFGLHELGHALGLGHSPVQQAIMYPVILQGERKGLHEDDIEGIEALYEF